MNVNFFIKTPNIEETIVEIARVSSKRKNKKESPEKLIRYLIKNKHWSPFEHGYLTFEVITSRAIGTQILRHRSFTFQEFSQRYQKLDILSEDEFDPLSYYEKIELRKQAENNRQSSTEVFDPIVKSPYTGENVKASKLVESHLTYSTLIYDTFINAGVSRESARFLLPLATKTKLYITGNVRSWIHFLSLRDDSHAQKEIQEIAVSIKSKLKKEIPLIYSAVTSEK